MSLLDAVAKLEGLVREAAETAERERTYPRRVIEALAETGLFKMLAPCAAGGLEMEPLALLEVVEEVSRWDGSAGWLAMIGSGASFLGGYLETAVAQELFKEPNAFVCGNL